MKAKKANFDSITVSGEDKTQIMLTEIIDRIAELQRTRYTTDNNLIKDYERERNTVRFNEKIRSINIRWSRVKEKGSDDMSDANNIINDIESLKAYVENNPIFDVREKTYRLYRLNQLLMEITYYYERKK